jgi:nucleoside-diphosphate-sugar epimerase
MKVVVTGATGYIGSAVAEAVERAGYKVYVLAHDDAATRVIATRGWTAIEGDIRDKATLEHIATDADAVLHVANTGGADAAAVDVDATRALLRGLAARGGTLVYTSGAWVMGSGRSQEASSPRPASIVSWRAELEQEVLRTGRVRGVVLRPGIVYGRGAGIPGMLLRGDLPLIEPGTQRWPLVHVEDLAQLYVLALDAPSGSVLHGVTPPAW